MKKVLLFTIILCAVSSVTLYSCNDTETNPYGQAGLEKTDTVAKPIYTKPPAK